MREEITRIKSLPEPTMNARHVRRWRKEQVDKYEKELVRRAAKRSQQRAQLELVK